MIQHRERFVRIPCWHLISSCVLSKLIQADLTCNWGIALQETLTIGKFLQEVVHIIRKFLHGLPSWKKFSLTIELRSNVSDFGEIIIRRKLFLAADLQDAEDAL